MSKKGAKREMWSSLWSIITNDNPYYGNITTTFCESPRIVWAPQVIKEVADR